MGLSGTRGAAAKQKGANKGEGVDGNAVLRLFGRWPILDLAFLRRGWFGLELPDCRAETWLGAGDGTGLACLLYRVWCVPAGTGTRRGEKKKTGGGSLFAPDCFGCLAIAAMRVRWLQRQWMESSAKMQSLPKRAGQGSKEKIK